MSLIKSIVRAKYGDNISTDNMTPSKFLDSFAPEDLAKICMYDVDPGFPERMAPGGVVVGAMNFGCGSSRETAPIALKACNVKAILAGEVGRIFYRNCINIGVPVLECPDVYDKLDLNDELEINLETGEVKDLTKGETYRANPVPPFLIEIIDKGGLLEVLKARVAQQK